MNAFHSLHVCNYGKQASCYHGNNFRQGKSAFFNLPGSSQDPT